MTQFSIKPDWKPIETAPKDRPIWVATRSINHLTGEQRHSHTQVYWGRMRDYPDHGEMWLPVGGYGNSLHCSDDLPFRKEVSIHDDHGSEREIAIWRGHVTTHWADIIPYTVYVVPPPEVNWPLPVETVTTDRREKQTA